MVLFFFSANGKVDLLTDGQARFVSIICQWLLSRCESGNADLAVSERRLGAQGEGNGKENPKCQRTEPSPADSQPELELPPSLLLPFQMINAG